MRARALRGIRQRCDKSATKALLSTRVLREVSFRCIYTSSSDGNSRINFPENEASDTALKKVTFHSPRLLHNESRTYTTDDVSVSERVDRLLAHTRLLMGKSTSRHFVAFSGGVDSSLVAALLRQCQNDHGEQVHAILGLSPAVPQEQLTTAKQVADHIGIPLSIIRTKEGEDETYLANEGQACLACKTHLYSSMRAVVDHINNDNKSSPVSPSSPRTAEDDTLQLYNGTNADDVKDPTRLGLIAAQNFRVVSPLQHMTKDDVRQISKHLGLPNWNYAASPCLRSRLALGVPATADHLHRIEEAERYVRTRLNFVLDETSNMRVRLLSGNHARIEMDADHVKFAQEVDWDDKFCGELGFSAVSIKPFRSGSVATKIKDDHRESRKGNDNSQNSTDGEEDVVVSLHG